MHTDLVTTPQGTSLRIPVQMERTAMATSDRMMKWELSDFSNCHMLDDNCPHGCSRMAPCERGTQTQHHTAGHQ